MLLLTKLGILAVTGIIGSLLNKMRGGWGPVSGRIPYSSYVAFLYTGLIFWYVNTNDQSPGVVAEESFLPGCARNIQCRSVWHCLLSHCFWTLFVVMFVAVRLAISFGWGPYFGMAHGAGIPDRYGAYDWLVGFPATSWSHWRKFERCTIGMTIRGFIWSAIPGFFFYWYDVPSTSAFVVVCFGLLMPIFYELGFEYPIPNPWNFIATDNAELQFGAYSSVLPGIVVFFPETAPWFLYVFLFWTGIAVLLLVQNLVLRWKYHDDGKPVPKTEETAKPQPALP
eukprot:TRINITY_DN34103_c0_g1_i1.p1 TRINITY_DN34103_c0_g1~~TRINITY_DN34103_c0_g1_i1.p1  ORF type:complete len:282 (-),score=21.24 TRINITY_DN34103_c0_g1_i1:32-877(-)